MPKFFSIVEAHYTGIFSSWLGKGMAGDVISGYLKPVYKSCKNIKDAETFWKANCDTQPGKVDTIVSAVEHCQQPPSSQEVSPEHTTNRRNPSRVPATSVNIYALDNPHTDPHPAPNPPLNKDHDYLQPGPKQPPDTSRTPDRYDDIFTNDVFGDVRTGLLKLAIVEARTRSTRSLLDDSRELEQCL